MEEPKPWQNKSRLEKIVNGAVDLGTMGAAASKYLTSTLLTYAGFTTADIISKKKKGEKLTARTIGKSLWDNAAHASQNAFAQEEMYNKIDWLPNDTLLKKIGKTIMFNPVVAGAYQLYYQAQQYIRDEIGWTRAAGSLVQPKKLKMYLKDFYETRLKGKYWKKVWTVFKRVAPIHFASINYVDSMPVKMGIAAGNDVIFSLASKPEKEREYAVKPRYEKRDDRYGQPYRIGA